jgi:hypothetical protein
MAYEEAVKKFNFVEDGSEPIFREFGMFFWLGFPGTY